MKRSSLVVQPFSILAALLLTLVQAPLVSGSTPALPPGVTTDHPMMYRVRQRTKVMAPRSGPACNKIRVWHALPNTRPWSRVTTNIGITALSYVPKTGKIEVGDVEEGGHIVFSSDNIRPGTQLVYESDFQVISANRTFNPHSRTIFWNQYSKKDLELGEEIDEIHPTLAAVANELKRDNQPIMFVMKASEWVRENIKYDASVAYGNEDIDQIMTNRRGHCGHAQNILKQLLGQARIPYKPVFGLNLVDRNGGLNEDRIRLDYSNNHMWAQVYFPSIGWVEVDSFQGDKCYFIPACMIQNNTGFQNYSVWVDEEGKESRMPNWSCVNGRFICDYSVDNAITYSEQAM